MHHVVKNDMLLEVAKQNWTSLQFVMSIRFAKYQLTACEKEETCENMQKPPGRREARTLCCSCVLKSAKRRVTRQLNTPVLVFLKTNTFSSRISKQKMNWVFCKSRGNTILRTKMIVFFLTSVEIFYSTDDMNSMSAVMEPQGTFVNFTSKLTFLPRVV